MATGIVRVRTAADREKACLDCRTRTRRLGGWARGSPLKRAEDEEAPGNSRKWAVKTRVPAWVLGRADRTLKLCGSAREMAGRGGLALALEGVMGDNQMANK